MEKAEIWPRTTEGQVPLREPAPVLRKRGPFHRAGSPGGRPQIEVVDGNYGNRGELLLDHRWTGTPLKMDYARRTLENLEKLWGRPVHLKTQIDSKVKILGYNGSRHEERNES